MCEPSCIKYTGGSSFTCSDKATARAVAKRTYESAVELFAMLCKQYNLNPTADGVIISHREGHSRGIASNHGDPEHLWNGLGMGYTMDGFRKAVKAKMNGSSKEYIRQSEPSKRDKGYAWHTAIGLQAVDGLKPSKYLIDTAIKNIEGDISIDEAQELLNTYYEENPKADTDDRTEEADKVAVRIAKILSEKAFSFTPNEYISIHKKLFAGIYGHAGKLRDYNITKKEWVLNGATVLYGSASELRATLDYDFAEEKKFSYKNLSMEEIIHHLAFFVSRLWQIHVFGEGNTRTTAVFFIKYLRTLGFDATNDIFAENAWYFRNALVRANYNDLKNGVHETTEYLELFLRNLLLDEKNELHNRTMHISGRFAEVDIERVKVDIKSGEVDIESTKVDIRNKLLSFSDTISEKTINHQRKS